jgi:type I restriction enzyme, S subunit
MADKIIKSFDVWITAQGLKSKGRLRSVDNISLKGIARLRELILELAIRGKLVSQNSNEEPAINLIDHLSRKEAKKKNVLAPIDEGDKFIDLPLGWEWVKLGNVGSTNIGLTYSPANISDSGTPVLRSSNIQNGKICYDDLVRVRGDIAEKNLVQKGDLLICARNGSKSLVGKCAIIPELNEQTSFGAFMAIFRSEINEYVKLFLESPHYRNRLEGVSTTTINQITQDNLKNTVIPLPPRAEQYRIVAKVDELMALCDELEKQEIHHLKSHQLVVETLLGTLTQASDAAQFQTAWSRLAQHFDDIFTTEDSIDQLKQTILQLAVMGKLVPQDPNDEPASELLKRIEQEKERLVKEGKIKKEKPLREVPNDDAQIELPNGWTWCRLGSFTTIKGGKRLPNGEVLTKQPTDHIYIRVTDMKNNTIDDTDLHYITETAYEKIKQYIIEKDDIYLTIVGATIGKLGLVPDKFHRMNLTENAARIIIYEVDKLFLSMFMNSDFIQSQFFDKTNQVGVPKLALHRVSNSIVPLPPLQEQLRIRDKIEELYAMCDRLEERIGESQKITNDLASSVLNLV